MIIIRSPKCNSIQYASPVDAKIVEGRRHSSTGSWSAGLEQEDDFA